MGATNQVSNGNSSFTDYSTAKLFLGGNSFLNGNTFTNGGGSEVTLAKGTVVGRLTADQKLSIVTDSAVDGSQIPVGIVADDYTVGAGATITNVVICTAGEVDENLLVLDGADTLDTVITNLGRTIRDAIGAETVGVILRDSTGLNAVDNS